MDWKRCLGAGFWMGCCSCVGRYDQLGLWMFLREVDVCMLRESALCRFPMWWGAIVVKGDLHF